MSLYPLEDPQVHALLFHIDRELAATKAQGCKYCGGRLHEGGFARKPRDVAMRFRALFDWHQLRLFALPSTHASPLGTLPKPPRVYRPGRGPGLPARTGLPHQAVPSTEGSTRDGAVAATVVARVLRAFGPVGVFQARRDFAPPVEVAEDRRPCSAVPSNDHGGRARRDGRCSSCAGSFRCPGGFEVAPSLIERVIARPQNLSVAPR